MIVYHQRNRFSGKSRKTYILEVAKRDNIDLKDNKFELDHIIPFCISQNNSLENLQVLTHLEHRKKTIIDFKILRELRKLGFYEKITDFYIEILVEKDIIIKKYLELLQKYNKNNQVNQVNQVGSC